MIGNTWEQKCDVAEPRDRVIDMTGAGTSVPTKNVGAGATLSRTGVGDYKITWGETPGKFVGVESWTIRSATGIDVKNYSVVFKRYDATNRVLELFVFTGAGAAVDLTSAQDLTVIVKFKETSVGNPT